MGLKPTKKNTGELLLAKEYNSIIDGRVRSLQENGLLCDGSDDTLAFRTLISDTGNTEVYFIITSTFLIGDDTLIVVPRNIHFIMAGGFIRLNNNANIRFNGNFPQDHVQIFEFVSQLPDNLPNLQINEQEWISPIWFGWKMSGLNADAIINYYAFRAAFNCAGRLSETSHGSSIQLPSGVGYMNGFQTGIDGVNVNSKFTSIKGAGKRKTVIKLANNENKSLFHLNTNFDFDIDGIEFDGNKNNNTLMLSPVISLDYYRIGLKNFSISNFNKIGLRIESAQTNAIHIENPNIYLGGNESTGIEIYGALNVHIGGVIDIENCIYGVDIYGTNTTILDSRYNQRVVIDGSWYAEQLQRGVRLFGTTGVKVDVACYAREALYFAEIKYDDTRDMPSMFNYIDVRGIRDEKEFNNNNSVLIEDRCPFNTVFTDPGFIVTDNDGRNAINRDSWGEVIPINDFTGNNFTPDTNPKLLYHINYELVSGNTFNDVINYDVNGVNHLKILPSGDIRIQYVTLQSGTYYYLIKMKGTPGANTRLGILCDDGSRYDHARKKFTSPPDPYDTYYYYFHLTGDWQIFRVPIIIEVERRVYSILYATDGSYEVDYFNLSDNKTQGFVHVKSGSIVGYNEKSHYISTQLPSANLMLIGTKNFCPDLGHEVISDGNNWKKPDGTNI